MARLIWEPDLRDVFVQALDAIRERRSAEVWELQGEIIEGTIDSLADYVVSVLNKLGAVELVKEEDEVV